MSEQTRKEMWEKTIAGSDANNDYVDAEGNWVEQDAPWLEQQRARFHGEPEMRVEFGVLMGENVAQSSSLFSAQILAEQVGGKVVRRTVSMSRWEEV